jgi:hypothetical protein
MCRVSNRRHVVILVKWDPRSVAALYLKTNISVGTAIVTLADANCTSIPLSTIHVGHCSV